MLDFMEINENRSKKRGDMQETIEIYPDFILQNSNDLMIRGGDFYAIWVEDKGMWSTNQDDAVKLIDRELRQYRKHNLPEDARVKIKTMRSASSGTIDKWHKYCQKQMWDNYIMLDEKLIFSNTKVEKTDYASKRLSYPLEYCDISGYEKLISTLYEPEERHKIEWAIGAIVSGDSKWIQKFMVLYGAVGAGKSTMLNIIEKLFDGYCGVFTAKDLGSSTNAFALEAFRNNPLVAIQHDGDLSRIEDNTRLNSLVSHEKMMVNAKFEKEYSASFKCFLFMGTNKPVKITDAKSGLIRRLIDVVPSGKKLPVKEYNQIVQQIDFELGGIAKHCLDVYLEAPDYYDHYIPLAMLGASNSFYNFMLDNYCKFKQDDGVGANVAWKMYCQYVEDAKIPYPLSKMTFINELSSYFRDKGDRGKAPDGTNPRNYYSGFKTEMFENDIGGEKKNESGEPEEDGWIKLVPANEGGE